MKILLLILLHLCNRNIRMEQKRSAALKLSSCTYPLDNSWAAHLGDELLEFLASHYQVSRGGRGEESLTPSSSPIQPLSLQLNENLEEVVRVIYSIDYQVRTPKSSQEKNSILS